MCKLIIIIIIIIINTVGYAITNVATTNECYNEKFL
jgi:hypothetical protein